MNFRPVVFEILCGQDTWMDPHTDAIKTLPAHSMRTGNNTFCGGLQLVIILFSVFTVILLFSTALHFIVSGAVEISLVLRLFCFYVNRQRRTATNWQMQRSSRWAVRRRSSTDITGYDLSRRTWKLCWPKCTCLVSSCLWLAVIWKILPRS